MSSSPGARRSPITLIGSLLLVAIIVVGGGVLAVTGAGARIVEGLYPPIAVTEQGAKIRDLYDIVFFIAVAIFFLVEGLIVWTVIRYRRRPQDVDLPPQTHGNAIAEIVWTVVPTIIVAFMFVLSWQTLNEMDTPTAQPDIKIRAVAGQFQWQFDYMPADYEPTPGQAGPAPLYQQFAPLGPDGGLTVPTGRTVQLYLTSPDVIHAFYVPVFLFKRDVVPGQVNKFDFKVDEDQAGQTFRGQCAELCGSGHRIMLFEVHAVSGPNFDAWLAAKIEGAPPPASPPPSAPAASGSAPSGPPVAGTTLSVVAQNATAFATPTLTAPANSPITIEFDNQDTLPHNVKLFKDAIGGAVVYDGEIFTGPAKRSYPVGPLAAGTYPFVCAVHTNMTGTLTVQ
jgi:cytochrome c oxidase subunit 2